MSRDARTLCQVEVSVSILDRDDMQSPRNAIDLRVWVSEKLELVGRAPIDIRQDYRLKRGLFKEFADEIIPLSVYMVHRHINDLLTTCKPVLGGQPYDAVLNINREGQTSRHKIEITYAIDGYQESLRMEKLGRDRSVSALRSLSPQGSGKPGDRVVIYSGEARRNPTKKSLITQRESFSMPQGRRFRFTRNTKKELPYL